MVRSQAKGGKPPNPNHKKLPPLPKDSRVIKRPLLHPAIPSPHASWKQPKVIYVSTRTPFLSAVKRAEKLLRLADRRAVQSATTLTKKYPNHGRKRDARQLGADNDDIAQIAAEAERAKSDGVREEVVLKGTGKAIAKVMEIGGWFRKREEEFIVMVKTGTVAAVDDVEVGVEQSRTGDRAGDLDVQESVEDGADDMDIETGEARDGPAGHDAEGGVRLPKPEETAQEAVEAPAAPETRIRYTSVLEVAVSLR